VTIGPLVRVDFILPDRPMDLQLCVTLPSQTIAIETPSELMAYHESVVQNRSSDDSISRPQATPPTRIVLPNNDLFILESAHHIVCSVRHLPSSISSSADGDTWPELRDMLLRRDLRQTTTSGWAQEIAHAKARAGVEVNLESARDLDSSDSSDTCFVECQDSSDDLAWSDFLRKCDLLTTHIYPSVSVGNRSPALASPTL